MCMSKLPRLLKEHSRKWKLEQVWVFFVSLIHTINKHVSSQNATLQALIALAWGMDIANWKYRYTYNTNTYTKAPDWCNCHHNLEPLSLLLWPFFLRASIYSCLFFLWFQYTESLRHTMTPWKTKNRCWAVVWLFYFNNFMFWFFQILGIK
jgi:hypothetical protein